MKELNQIAKLYRRIKTHSDALDLACTELFKTPGECLDRFHECGVTISKSSKALNALLKDNNLPPDTILHLEDELEFAVWCKAQWG